MDCDSLETSRVLFSQQILQRFYTLFCIMVDWCSEQSKFQTLAPDSYLKNGEAQRGSQPNSLHFHLPNTVEYFIKFENVLGMYSSNLPVIFLCLHNPHHSLIFRYFFTKPGNPLFFKQNVMEWTKAVIQCSANSWYTINQSYIVNAWKRLVIIYTSPYILHGNFQY